MALKDRLLDPIQTSVYGLAGNKGPEFENEGLMMTSDIQAFVGVPPTNTLLASQDLISGRLSRQIPFYPYFKAPSNPPVSFPPGDRKSTRLNSSHVKRSRMPSSA